MSVVGWWRGAVNRVSVSGDVKWAVDGCVVL